MKEFKITDYIKFPLKVDEYGIYVFDADNNMVLSSVDDDKTIPYTAVVKLNGFENLIPESSKFKDCFMYDPHTQSILYGGKDVMLVRGWGRIQYMENPEWVQDNIGQWIVDKLNE